MTTQAKEVIKLSKIQKAFGKKELFRGLELSVNQGEMIAIVGESGAGKTTLLNIIGVIEPLLEGEFVLFGKANIKPNSMKAQRLIRERISFLFQNFALIDNATVFENLAMALKYVKAKKHDKQKKVAQALQQVGLAGYEKLKIFELSGGEQQRIALARVLLKPSELILADEPTGSLDEENRNEIIQLLKKMNEAGKTILIVTHDPYVAEQCERVIAL